MGPRRDITFPMFGDGIFTQEGQAWKHSRDIIRPQFMHKQYENLDVFKEAVDDLMDILQTQKDGSVIDLQPLFFRMTLDVTTAFLFGESVPSLTAPETAGELSFADAFNTAQSYVVKRFRLLDLYWLIGGRTFRKACNDVHHFADQIIDRNLSQDSRTGENQGKHVFLDAVAKASPDRTAMRGQIINILVAGRDTTACLLSWTLYVMSTLSLS
jgi:cytochrome P450